MDKKLALSIINAVDTIDEYISEPYYEDIDIISINDQLDWLWNNTTEFRPEICEIQEEMKLSEYEISTTKIRQNCESIKNSVLRMI